MMSLESVPASAGATELASDGAVPPTSTTASVEAYPTRPVCMVDAAHCLALPARLASCRPLVPEIQQPSHLSVVFCGSLS